MSLYRPKQGSETPIEQINNKETEIKNNIISPAASAVGLTQVEGPNSSYKDFSYNPFYGGTGGYLFKPVIPGFNKPLYISAVPFERHGIGVLLGMDLELDTHWLVNAEWQQRVSNYYSAPEDEGDFSPSMCTLGLTYLF